MHDYALRFDSESAAAAVLFEPQAPDQAPGQAPLPRYDAVDVIGVIYRPTGDICETPQGPTPVMEPLPGWHVNVRHRYAVPELDPYVVRPHAPARIWA